ncbi:addiction module protein [uncultured Thiodictyon sp.]|jgi:putative addiction module component (TIGR02574 family)|uniref:addiction module protein n=1 Tax=uncultured Thiodictyon sp. TaxID=1846217 RepID=UPI0025E277F9|nr:addiction module protein [uncultured Thiodictyon sp.]
MTNKDLLAQALTLHPEDRFQLVEGILKSLDEPDLSLDAIWAEEAEKRIQAYREGRLEVIAMEDIFRDEASAGSVGRRADPQTGPAAPRPRGCRYAAPSDCYT